MSESELYSDGSRAIFDRAGGLGLDGSAENCRFRVDERSSEVSVNADMMTVERMLFPLIYSLTITKALLSSEYPFFFVLRSL